MDKSNIKKNTAYNIIKTASAVIFPLITFPYISRVLQPENIGKINFGSSITGYIAMLATLGVNTYAVRECAKVKGNREQLMRVSGQILSINMITTAIAYILLGILLVFSTSLKDYRLLIGIQSLSVIFTTFGADWLNTAMEDFRYITLRTVIFQMISLILMVLFVRQPDDYMKYAFIMVFAASGSNVMNIFYRKKYCITKLTFKMEIKKHLPPILGLFAMLVAQQIFTMCDTTIIGLLLGDYEVGLYSIALKVYYITNQVIVSITWVVMPRLCVAYTNDHILEIEKLLKYVLQFTFILGVPCVVGIFMISPEIIIVIGGKVYLGATRTLRVLSISLAATFMSNFFLNINLLASGKDKICAIICGIISVFNIITNLLFIPMFGITAAAVTTLCSQILIVCMCIPFLDSRINIFKMFIVAIKPIVAVFGMAFVVDLIIEFTFNNYVCVAASIAFGGITYFSILILLKEQIVIGCVDKFIAKLKEK